MIYKIPQCFLQNVKSIGLSVQEKKRKIDFQDGDHGGHLGFPIGTSFALYDLHPTASYGSQSIRTQVNSYSSQLVLILVNSYSSIWSIRTHLVNSYSLFGQFVLILVNSSSYWSTRTHVFWSIRTHFRTSIGDANRRKQNKTYLTPLKRKIKSIELEVLGRTRFLVIWLYSETWLKLDFFAEEMASRKFKFCISRVYRRTKFTCRVDLYIYYSPGCVQCTIAHLYR